MCLLPFGEIQLNIYRAVAMRTVIGWPRPKLNTVRLHIPNNNCYTNHTLAVNNPTFHLPNIIIISHVDSARNLCAIFDENRTLAQQISAVLNHVFASLGLL